MTGPVALAAPALLALYGLCRIIDGLDGGHGPGLSWTIGQLAFLASILGFGVLAVQLARTAPRRLAPITGAELTAMLAGVVLFVWVILTDLVPSLDQVWEPSDVLMRGAPAALSLGLTGLLALNIGSEVAPWTPIVFLGAFIVIGVGLDFLLPAAAAMVLSLRPRAHADPVMSFELA
jgi:hypothetical protein